MVLFHCLIFECNLIVCWGNTVQRILAQQQHSVILSEALDPLSWEMYSESCHHISVTIKMDCIGVHSFDIDNILIIIAIAKDHVIVH